MGCRDIIASSTVVGIRCHVNAALGREAEYKVVPSKRPKKVIVVGGGPAGMETARIAALRGHQVTLYEREDRLGGQLNQAVTPPHKDRIKSLIRYLETQIRKLGVEIKLGIEVSATLVEQLSPDVVVLATGVTPLTPNISGIDKIHTVHAGEVLEGKVDVGSRVVVIGGELVGCETAEFLVKHGKKVTVTRRGPEMAMGMGPFLRPALLNRLSAKEVTLLTGVTYNEITPQGLRLTTKEGQAKTIEADTIVLAAGAVSNNKLYDELENKVPVVNLVGDCAEPRTIREAIADGFLVALAL